MIEAEVQLFDYNSLYSEDKTSSSYWNRGWNIGKIVSVTTLVETIPDFLKLAREAIAEGKAVFYNSFW